MIITLLKKDRIFSFTLPEKISGQYWVTQYNISDEIEYLNNIEALNNHWYLKSNQNASVISTENNKLLKTVLLEELNIYNINIKKNNENAILYTEPVTRNRKLYTKFVVNNNTDLYIGRAENNDICYNNKFVSSKHARLCYKNNQWFIEDLSSANGTFVNGYRIKSKELKPGDCIYILGLKLLFAKDFFAFNNPDDKVTHNMNLLKAYHSPEFHPTLEEEDKEDIELSEEFYYISPRFKKDIEVKDIVIDAPPAPEKMDDIPIALVIGPSLTMGTAALATGIFSVINVLNNGKSMMEAMPTLVLSFSMLIGTVLWPLLTKRYEKKHKYINEKKRQDTYLAYLAQTRDRIKKESSYQAEILQENHITIDQAVNRINRLERTLWERLQEHNDFLTVRLGKGNLSLKANIKYPDRKFSMYEDNLLEELYCLAEEPKTIENVPISYSFCENNVTGIIGKRSEVLRFANGIITQIAALHSYTQVKMVFVISEQERKQWEFTKWLPHVWSKDNKVRYLAGNAEDAKELYAHLKKEITTRKEDKNRKGAFEFFYVVFLADMQLANQSGITSLLINEASEVGFSTVTLFDQLKNLPKECSAVIELEKDTSKIYDKEDISGVHTDFTPDIFIGNDINDIALTLSNIKVEDLASSYKLPNMLSFLEMFRVGKVEHLNALSRWRDNNPTKTIQTPVGVDTTGGLFYLDLHEKFHGPHGLIAGMTGSGKSEFIITFILSLAVNYHPNEVAFILIDYKGGGLTGAFENEYARLPHLAGTITNLDGASIKRSLISIQSELRRRQAIFNDARKVANEGTMDIYLYQKLYRDKIVTEPLPHLFIISDEFAELKTQQPEFMEQLISAARIGRSLGIHLILATQKPSGVVDDQIWSNSRFKVCLKVQERADSMDMIKRPDAAELSNTGRFYLQVGFNEFFDLGQSAWCGAPYIPSDRVENKKDKSIEVIDALGRVIKSQKPVLSKVVSISDKKQNTQVLKYLSDLAAEEQITIRRLWLDAIPAVIYVDKLKKKYNYCKNDFEINPVIGEYDDPFNQKQSILTLPISREGNAVLYGSVGSGKTQFLTTMLLGLINDYSTEELNLYIIDMAETLKCFDEAPQVGDVMLAEDQEKILNLFRMLRKEVADRKKVFSAYGGGYSSYCAAEKEPKPNLMVVINNYTALTEAYDFAEDAIAYLSREGVKLGIYFVISSSSTNGVRYRILQNFKQHLTLQQNDPADYISAIGNTEGVRPSKLMGRGIVKLERVYEYQVAHFMEGDEEIHAAVKKIIVQSGELRIGGVAKPIPVMPKYLSSETFKEMDYMLDRVPVGIDKISLESGCYNFIDSYLSLILSRDDDVSGILQGITQMVAQRGLAQVKVFDTKNGYTADEKCGYEIISEQFEEQLIEMFYLIADRNNSYKDNNGKFLSGQEPSKMLYIINSLPDLITKLSDDGKEKLQLLLEKGEAIYNVNIIIACSSIELSKMMNTAWYQKHCINGNGIWVGNGIMDRTVIRLNRVANELYQEIPDGFGYIIQKGKYRLVKLVTYPDRSEYDE